MLESRFPRSRKMRFRVRVRFSRGALLPIEHCGGNMIRLFRRMSAAILVLAIFGATHAAVFANVIQVPAAQSTIQAAVNASANGDTIQVAPGTYFENINFS